MKKSLLALLTLSMSLTSVAFADTEARLSNTQLLEITKEVKKRATFGHEFKVVDVKDSLLRQLSSDIFRPRSSYPGSYMKKVILSRVSTGEPLSCSLKLKIHTPVKAVTEGYFYNCENTNGDYVDMSFTVQNVHLPELI